MLLQTVQSIQSSSGCVKNRSIMDLKGAPDVRLELVDELLGVIMTPGSKDCYHLWPGLSQYIINGVLHQQLAICEAPR